MFPDPDYNVLGARVCLPATSRNAPLPDYNEGLAASEKVFSYARMPLEEVERSMRLFAAEVMPDLKSFQTDVETARQQA